MVWRGLFSKVRGCWKGVTVYLGTDPTIWVCFTRCFQYKWDGLHKQCFLRCVIVTQPDSWLRQSEVWGKNFSWPTVCVHIECRWLWEIATANYCKAQKPCRFKTRLVHNLVFISWYGISFWTLFIQCTLYSYPEGICLPFIPLVPPPLPSQYTCPSTGEGI